MEKQLTIDDARQSLAAHLAVKGAELRAKYGPQIDWEKLPRILGDRACVRYPCEIQFGSEPLQPGEVAWPSPKGPEPEAGFIIYVHPHYQSRLDRVPWLVLYQLVQVNYGEFASADDAEIFGAQALGLSKDEYYAGLCCLADELPKNANQMPTFVQPPCPGTNSFCSDRAK
jgi:hypothetical protein